MQQTVFVGVTVLLLATASVVRATDKHVFACESKAAAAVGKWGGARGKCLVTCDQALLKGDTTRTCSSPPGPFDPATKGCTDAADTKYVAAVVKACPDPTFPTCASYNGFTPTSYAQDQITMQSALIDPVTVPVLMCDDTMVKCEGKVIGALAKLSGAISTCLTKCYQALQVKGETLVCTPQAGPDPFGPIDPVKAKPCVDKAVTKANDSITNACPSLPACGLYLLGQPALLNLVTGSIAGNYAAPASNPYCAP